jgi:hypothetical protein
MTMPRFTAETSLYENSQRYWLAAVWDSSTSEHEGLIEPAGLLLFAVREWLAGLFSLQAWGRNL